MELNIDNVMELAINAGWTKGVTRNGRTFYRTPNGKREWIDARWNSVSVGAWFLWNNRNK